MGELVELFARKLIVLLKLGGTVSALEEVRIDQIIVCNRCARVLICGLEGLSAVALARPFVILGAVGRAGSVVVPSAVRLARSVLILGTLTTLLMQSTIKHSPSQRTSHAGSNRTLPRRMLRFFLLGSVFLLALALAGLLLPLPLLPLELLANLAIIGDLPLTLLRLALHLDATTRLFSRLGLLAPVSLFAQVVFELTLTLAVFLFALLSEFQLRDNALLVFFSGEALGLFLESSCPIGPATLAVFPFSLLAELAVVLFLLLAIEAEPNSRARLAILACDDASGGNSSAADESGVSHEAALGLRGARNAPAHGWLAGGTCRGSHRVFGGSLGESWLEGCNGLWLLKWRVFERAWHGRVP